MTDDKLSSVSTLKRGDYIWAGNRAIPVEDFMEEMKKPQSFNPPDYGIDLTDENPDDLIPDYDFDSSARIADDRR